MFNDCSDWKTITKKAWLICSIISGYRGWYSKPPLFKEVLEQSLLLRGLPALVVAYLVTPIFCLEGSIRISYSLYFEHQVARSKEIPTCGPTMSYWRLTQKFTFRSPRGRLPSLKCFQLWVPWYFQKGERLVPFQKEIPTRLSPTCQIAKLLHLHHCCFTLKKQA